MNLISLNAWDLGLAAAAVLAMAGCTMWLRLGLGRDLIVACVRMGVQLFLIGFVLKHLFATSNAWWIGGMALVMLLVAAREVFARQKRRMRGWWGFGGGALSMFISSFVLTVFALAVIVKADPWYAPQYAIPILGMLLGNTMTGVALATDRLTQSLWQQRAIIEQRLMLGQTGREACHEIVRESLRSGLIPIVNAIAVTGLVSLPGMMTGQILAGSPPLEAVKYQILIWLLIAAGSGFGMLISVLASVSRLFDGRQRLRLDRLRPARDR